MCRHWLGCSLALGCLKSCNRLGSGLRRLSSFSALALYRLGLIRLFALFVFVRILIVIAFVHIEGKVDLRNAKANVVVVTAAHVIKVIVALNRFLGLVIFVEGLLGLGLSAPLATRP